MSSADGAAVDTRGATERLGAWIASASRAWPEEARHQAARAFIDTLACMLAGVNDEAPRRALAGVGAWGGEGTSVIGTPRRLAAPWAALVNGTAAHALDYDDVLDPAGAHVSAVLVSAVLALAEERDAGGAAALDAYLVGFEVMERLAESVNMTHYALGWHTTLTLGAPAAAAACARLLGLDATAARNAISIATSLAGGFKRQFGTNTKPLHAGLAAKNGILAAQLAAAGMTASPDAFEGDRGFRDLMAGPDSPGFAAGLKGLGGTPAMLDPGVWFKPYPCCASTHRAIDALLALRIEHGLAPANVTEIEASVSEIATRNLMYTVPTNEMEARFSMPWCLAAALQDGAVRLATFRPDALGRADLRALLPRVRMTVDPRQPASMPPTEPSWATVVVRRADGRSLSRQVVYPKGYPKKPLSDAELDAKFRDGASGVLDPTATDAALAALRGLAGLASLRDLAARLMPSALQRAAE